MDDPIPAVRHAASEALGASLVAAIAHPYVTAAMLAGDKKKGAKPKFGSAKMFETLKKAEAGSAIEAVASLLVRAIANRIRRLTPPWPEPKPKPTPGPEA